MAETDLESNHAGGDGRFQLPYTRLSPSIPLNRLSFPLNRRPNPPGQVPKDPIGARKCHALPIRRKTP